MRRRKLYELDVPVCGVQPSDEVPTLNGEPQHAMPIEYRRVRIARRRIRHLILRHMTRTRVKFADVTTVIRCVPDVAVPVGDEPVRPRVCGQRILLDRAGLRIEPPEN